MVPVLVPPESTDFEKAISAVDANRISGIDVDIIRRIHSIDETPEAFLPIIAWEYSVDEWDPVWPISTKRAVIKVSYEVHRFKGTAYAVETAIEALGLGAKIEEWFEYAGAAYHFRLTVDLAQDEPWNAANADLLVRSALKTKNVRSKLDTTAIRRTTLAEGPFVGGFIRVNQVLRVVPDLPSEIAVRPYLYVGGALRVHQSIRVSPEI